MMKPTARRRMFTPGGLLPFLIVAMLTMTGCAHRLGPLEMPATYLWQAHDQYVAVAAKDASPDSAANDHPAILDYAQIQKGLASLQFRAKGSDTAIPLFTDYEISVLSEHIRTGLAQAGPNEDVVFAVIGNHTSLLGLAKRRMVTTGRVFLSKGKLNLIFGKLHEDVSDYEDRRLNPFVPGTRSASGSPSTGRVSSTLGGNGVVTKRDDWITLPLADLAENSLNQAKPLKNAETAPPITGSEPAVSKPVGKPRPALPSGKSPEERLRILNDLKDKHLISDEEYKTKRIQILTDF